MSDYGDSSRGYGGGPGGPGEGHGGHGGPGGPGGPGGNGPSHGGQAPPPPGGGYGPGPGGFRPPGQGPPGYGQSQSQNQCHGPGPAPGPGGFRPPGQGPPPQGQCPPPHSQGPPGHGPGSGPGFGGGYGRPPQACHDQSTGLQWISASNGHLPANPVQGGIERDGMPLFVARAMYKGGLHPGKAGQHLENGGCSIGWGHKEQQMQEYQVLCGDASKLKWVRQTGALDIRGFRPFPAGHEETGEPLYVAKTLYEGSQQLGKCAPHIKKGMSFPYGHKERTTDDYMVLAYAD